MFKKILVAIDGSETRSQAIFQQALTLAKMTDSQLMLLHVLCSEDHNNPGLPMRTYSVYYPPVDDVAWQTYQKRWDDYERSWVEKLKNMSDSAIAAGVPTEFTEAGGEPGKQICNLAKSWAADLIIVGSRGRKGIAEWLLGSISNYVMHHAPCSVLVVHNAATANASATTTEAAVVT
ncbi:MAG: universal stress protein [Cyanobacteria bacterium P01_A01_bin.123]